MDGWITIATTVVDKMDSGLKKIKNKLEKYEKDVEKNTTINMKLKAIEDKKNIQNISREIEELVNNYNKLMSSQILSDSDLRMAEQFKKDITEAAKQYEKITGEKIHIKGFEETAKSVSNINGSMTKVIKKVGKWALAIFSVRSAYSFIRNSVSKISQYNDKVAKNIEYINYATASILEPLIEKIVNLVYKLLQYLNYISYQWFGKNLFENADINKFSKLNKEAKELQKTLTGFDEMNILSDNSSTSLGIFSPDIDLSKIPTKVPEWIEWIGKNKDLFKEIAKYMLILFGAKTLSNINKIIGSASGLTGLAGMSSILGKINTLAMTVITIYFVVEAYNKVKEVVDILNETDNTYKQLEKEQNKQIEIEKQIREGLLKKIEAGELDNKSIKKNLNLIRDRIDLNQKEIDKQQEQIDNMSIWEKLTTNNYINYRNQLDLNINKVNEEIETLYELAKVFGFNDDVLKNFGFSTENLIEIMQSQIENIENLNNVAGISEEEYQKNIDKIVDLKTKINDLTKTEIQNEITKLEEKNKKLNSNSTEYQKNIDKIKSLKEKLNELNKVNPKVEVQITADTQKAEKNSANFFERLGESVTSVVDAGIGLFTGKGKNLGSKLKSIWKGFKFASGGIISLPGRGVPIGAGGIGGEAGREGVLPLTNQQAMAQLGEEIGKNVNINLTNVTKLDNRVISREQKRINTQNDFAYNR